MDQRVVWGGDSWGHIELDGGHNFCMEKGTGGKFCKLYGL